MKKVNRADLLTSLLKQLQANSESMPSHEGSGMLMVGEEIIPIIDISRPSKIPYQDWKFINANATGTLIPAVAGKRFVVTYMSIAYRNIVTTGTGTDILIGATINGSAVYIHQAVSVSAIYQIDSIPVSCEIVVDENTAITLTINGTYSGVNVIVGGYYVYA